MYFHTAIGPEPAATFSQPLQCTVEKRQMARTGNNDGKEWQGIDTYTYSTRAGFGYQIVGKDAEGVVIYLNEIASAGAGLTGIDTGAYFVPGTPPDGCTDFAAQSSVSLIWQQLASLF
jgi:hypothetical protein